MMIMVRLLIEVDDHIHIEKIKLMVKKKTIKSLWTIYLATIYDAHNFFLFTSDSPAVAVTSWSKIEKTTLMLTIIRKLLK